MTIQELRACRGRDLGKKIEIPWRERVPVADLGDGWTIDRIVNPYDCAIEGALLGHCAGAHGYWIKRNIEWFFSVRDPNGVPKATAHAHLASAWGKKQPEDNDLDRSNYHGYTLQESEDPEKPGISSTYYYHSYSANSKPIFKFEDNELILVSWPSFRSDRREQQNAVCEWFKSCGLPENQLQWWTCPYCYKKDCEVKHSESRY